MFLRWLLVWLLNLVRAFAWRIRLPLLEFHLYGLGKFRIDELEKVKFFVSFLLFYFIKIIKALCVHAEIIFNFLTQVLHCVHMDVMQITTNCVVLIRITILMFIRQVVSFFKVMNAIQSKVILHVKLASFNPLSSLMSTLKLFLDLFGNVNVKVFLFCLLRLV